VGWLETRKLPALFAIATLLPIAVLCWLGVRTLQQDERQRRRARLEVAAARVALEIEQDLQRIEAALTDGHGIRLTSSGILGTPETPIVFQPEVPASAATPSADLEDAGLLEHRDLDRALAAYRHAASSSSAAHRGEALVALGGLLRRVRRYDEALRVYAELEPLGMVAVAGEQPAGLVAKQGRAKTFLESGDTTRLREAAADLARSLRQGGWPIDRASFEMYQHDMVEAWGGPRVDAHDVQRAQAAAELWRSWRRGDLAPRGRRVGGSAGPALTIWVSGLTPVVAVLTSDELQTRWRAIWSSRALTAAVSGVDGPPLFGAVADGVVLPPSESLPFVLTVGTASPSRNDEDVVRRRTVIAGIVLAAMLMIAASYGLYRITARELLLARQQSDFVAAVSHEFRTPLTSMRHLLDLLIARRIRDEDRKAHYYTLLATETDRLQRMVETLLSFGRIDAGAHVWTLEPLNVADLSADVATAFRSELEARVLLVDLDDGLPPIRGDREALTRALWNLLENAAKYSPAGSPIRLFARREGSTVVLGVEDHGIGISGTEQQRVFQKFVRGDHAKRAGIRGVGVGLTLVKRIAEAHGGSVGLTSAVGSGSTFTLVLPVVG